MSRPNKFFHCRLVKAQDLVAIFVMLDVSGYANPIPTRLQLTVIVHPVAVGRLVRKDPSPEVIMHI